MSYDILKIIKISLKSKYNLVKLKGQEDLKVQFGSGGSLLDGWVNTDIVTSYEDFVVTPDVVLNITKPMPFNNNSVSFAYCEHLIEHITIEENIIFFKEVKRVLKKGGVFRVATPDLKSLVDKYKSRNWNDQDWLGWPEYRFISTPAEMLNIAMRWWGHKYLFDETEIVRRLSEAGFSTIKKVNWGKSKYPDLNGLESREDSKLVVEAYL